MKIDNSKVVLQVNLTDGAYFDFHFKDLPINPINWQTKDPEQPPFMGHFLCFDRWGPPTEAEKINGFQDMVKIWRLVSIDMPARLGVFTVRMLQILPDLQRFLTGLT